LYIAEAGMMPDRSFKVLRKLQGPRLQCMGFITNSWSSHRAMSHQAYGVSITLSPLTGYFVLLLVAASHVLGDLRTVRSFMEHWVAAYNGQQLPNNPMPHIHELLDDVARDRG
jgi:hypothetical protein